MTTKFTPLELNLIDEGRFMAQANNDLLDMERRLVRFMDTYGEKAKGAKAKMTIEISLAVEDPGDELVSVKAQIKKSIPASPASATLAMVAEDDKQQRCLFVRRSGSSATKPAQSVLSTEDGKTIDPDTGEPIKITGKTKETPE